MSFREKILWASTGLTLGVWGWYFWGFARALKAGRIDQGEAVAAFIWTVGVLVVLHIAVAIAIAIADRRNAGEPADEREKAFALEAYRPAYYVVAGGAVTLMVASPVVVRVAMEMNQAPLNDIIPVVLGNALLLVLVMGELVHAGAQLIRYRMGA